MVGIFSRLGYLLANIFPMLGSLLERRRISGAKLTMIFDGGQVCSQLRRGLIGTIATEQDLSLSLYLMTEYSRAYENAMT